ncbi:MAG: SusD/RagB family nutrient-binding outer membrane lipoprotein [Gemmatirosa sp.]
MLRHIRRAAPRAALVGLALVGAVACNDFLTGGDLDRDPNRPLTATPAQLFVGVQSNLWALLASDPSRISGLWTQQFEGGNIQYIDIYNYGRDESTTNGFYQSLYLGGGLSDVREMQRLSREVGDSLFVGIGQIQEALLIGTGADIFGDIVYTQALGDANPALDNQLAVYDSALVLLARGIANVSSTSSRNVGPGAADLVYGGDAESWARLARTLRARFHLHLAEVRGATAYQSALAEARLGIVDPADDYTATFAGGPLQQNFWYQFAVVNRPGYLVPGEAFVNLLEERNDPRLGRYFNDDQSDLHESLLQPNAPQPLVTANENLLIWAEAAFRTGNEAEARTQLNRARTIAGVPLVSSGASGQTLLREILTEKHIALFQSLEVWNDYKRTCFPNLTPVVSGQRVPARLFYDTAERQTNTSIPDPNEQPFRNRNDPANATSDATGEACRGQ